MLTDGAAALPSSGNVGSGTYSPTNYGGSDSFPAPAPALSAATALAAFNGTNPNGTWSLYIVDDSGNADVGFFLGGWSLTVTYENSAPVADDDSYTTAEDTVLTVGSPGVLGNDTDAESDPLTASMASGPSHGTLTFNSNGTFTYTPHSNYSGPDSFTYRASDGSTSSNLATISINVVAVNDAPIAADDTATTPEDTPTAVAVLANDSDIDGPSLAPVIVTPPANGSVSVPGDGTVLYTPNPNFTGTDTFTYQATDGSAVSNVAAVTVTVGPVNDAPAATDDGYGTAEDTALTVAAPGILANDSDVDGDPLAASLVTGPAHGTLAFPGDGGFTYTPNPDFNGTDTFTYLADDGPAASNVATVTIHVGALNDSPDVEDDAVSTPEDMPVGIVLTGSDPDGDPLTFSVVGGPASGVLSGSGANLTYTPNPNFSGSDSFLYQVCDGGTPTLCDTATVTITVTPANDAPTAADDSYSTNEDTALTVVAAGVLTNDGDLDGDELSAVLDSGPAHGTLSLESDGGLSYTPHPDFHGDDTFTYHATDGSATSPVVTVTITVVPVNDPPVAADDSGTTPEDTAVTIDVLANDADPDADPVTPAVVDPPMHGTVVVNADGTMTYTPAGGFEGTDAFTYHVGDGSTTSNVATVTVTVTHVNHPPTAADDDVTTTPGTAVTFDILANDTDPDGDGLTVSDHADPAHGSAVCTGGSCVYTPAAGYSGVDAFTYTINDGSDAEATATVRVRVTPPDPEPESQETPPVPTAPVTPFIQAETTAAPVVVTTSPVARTGASISYLVSLAGVLIVGGVVITSGARRSRARS